MTTFAIANFKYLVVNTGYSRGIMKKLTEFKELILDYLDYSRDCDCDDPEECPNPTCSDLVLYIEDPKSKTKLHKMSSNNEEIEKIRKLLSDEELDGHIVIRCDNINNAMNLIAALINLKYCERFSFTSLYEMKIVKEDFLIMRFECERA